MCAELFVSPTRGSKYIERTQKRDGQTERQMNRGTGGQTDNEAKSNMTHQFIGGGGRRKKNKRAQRALGRSPEEKVKGHSGATYRGPLMVSTKYW